MNTGQNYGTNYRRWKQNHQYQGVWCRRARGILVCAFGRTTCCFPDTTGTQLWRMPFFLKNAFDGLEEREVYFVVWERKLVLRKGGKKRSRSWCRKRRHIHTQKNGQSQIGNTKNYCVTSSTSSHCDRSYVGKIYIRMKVMRCRSDTERTDEKYIVCLFDCFFCLIRCIYCKPTKGAGNRVESITHDWCEPERACIRGRWVGRGSVCSIGRQ